MNGATRSNTTAAPEIHRRGMLAGTAAVLLLAPVAAGICKAQEIDGELLARCAEFQAHDREQGRIDTALAELPAGVSRAEHDAIWAQLQAVAAQLDAALDAIINLPARTPEGLAAKAAVLRLATQLAIDIAPDAHELLALSLADDIAGRA